MLHASGARKTVQTLNFELQAVPATFKLTYFDMPGLAETTRLCFAVAGTPFEDIRLSNMEDFKVQIHFFLVPWFMKCWTSDLTLSGC